MLPDPGPPPRATAQENSSDRDAHEPRPQTPSQPQPRRQSSRPQAPQPPRQDMPPQYPPYSRQLPYLTQPRTAAPKPETTLATGVSFIAFGVLLGISAYCGMRYLNRGEYRPENVLMLLSVCAAVFGCLVCLVGGATLLMTASVERHRQWHARPGVTNRNGNTAGNGAVNEGGTGGGITAPQAPQRDETRPQCA
ncbi:hypothetical protein [Bifidobacterium biavatii]|uniref:Uncharacterized protein n=1 Tax=Bifidobacterium biavatii DSM 23969 TaxID=1437608 RepID=A0A087A593_9BIFI|nr:hypothetical protein [Bifidobacterium biavatii]KFI53943.1 hypothetical protein BBIA_1292 [Bifidobacterium biavatii DSM 23969]